jgi:hypothetical protein
MHVGLQEVAWKEIVRPVWVMAGVKLGRIGQLAVYSLVSLGPSLHLK